MKTNMMKAASISLILGFSITSNVNAACPFMQSQKRQGEDEVPSNVRKLQAYHQFDDTTTSPDEQKTSDNSQSQYYAETFDFDRHLSVFDREATIPEGGFEAVEAEIEQLLTDSMPFFPADFGNYGPFFMRLSWHCAGSYRISDGRGGCDGGRIRFDPEFSWPDNANLDQALLLLKPIKEKFGPSLSWGDLIALSGTVAIRSLGGPIIGFCGGRVDDYDGFDSLPLGPTALQRDRFPCEVDGACEFPLGPTSVGLIYVNPEGPQGVPDPLGSANDVRNTFTNMGMDDGETVALVGGGHAFGKFHGACPDPPCGEGELQGIGPNTFTSGLEGQWTTNPIEWDNEYFNNLIDFDWQVTLGPGGRLQWDAEGTPIDELMMLTADIALRDDPIYSPFVNMYAANLTALGESFSAAWYKLTTRDMGPVSRCLGNNVPPAQPFQLPLPDPPAVLPDFIPVRSALEAMLADGDATVEAFVRLAFQCASTFRATDFFGGCNGARIRFTTNLPENEGADEVLANLVPIHNSYPLVSWADLIVLAGQTALEFSSNLKLDFCGGRTDAPNNDNADFLRARTFITDPVDSVKDDIKVRGLSLPQGVALFGRPTDMRTIQDRASNELFVNLIKKAFEPGTVEGTFFAKDDSSIVVTAQELALSQDFALREVVTKFARDEELFLSVFSSAWTQLMIADRFGGPTTNICEGVSTPTLASADICQDKQYITTFQADESGSSLSGGDRINSDTVVFSGGLTIGARRSQDARRGAFDDGMIFDTTVNPRRTNDVDLIKDPSRDNILIISGNGNSFRPDDNASGGQIVFNFADGLVRVDSITLVDVEQGSKLRFFAGGQSPFKEVFVRGGSNGEVREVPIGVEGVEKFILILFGPGGIDDVTFSRLCDQTE